MLDNDIQILQAGNDDVPQADRPEEPKKVLKLARQIREQSQSILKLAKNRWYVTEDANLLDLADDLAIWTGIQAVGVISAQGKVAGIIARRDIFDLLGRPFGRDVLKREPVSKVAQVTPIFHVDSNIFNVSEEIGTTQDTQEIRFFPLRTGTGEFAGIFSSQDLMLYLSDLARKDVALAAQIQGRIVKEYTHLDQDRFELVAASLPAKGVGGDFCHVRQLPDDSWFSCVCDVSGKGMSACLITTAIWSIIQSGGCSRGLPALLARLNKFLITTFQQDRFITGAFMELHPQTDTLAMADCGHGYCYIFRDNKLLHMKSGEKNYPLGVSPDTHPKLSSYRLLPGDIVIVLTDGIIRQGNEDSDEYGLSRIKQIISRYHQSGLKTLKVRLLEDLDQYRGNTPLQDDISFQFIRYKGR